MCAVAWSVHVHAISFLDSTLDEDVIAGQPFNISWTDAQGPVTITLRVPDAFNPELVTTIASTFIWCPTKGTSKV